jgi:hypothetical protein
MVSYRPLLFLFCLSSLTGFSQTINRYFVSFKDKDHTPYSISNPAQFLSAKSIARRAKEQFAVTTDDLPVDPNYVSQVKATGVSVFFTSRWFNGVLIQGDPSLVTAISSLPFVSKVERVAYGKRLINGRKKFIESQAQASSATNQFQLQMIGLDDMHTAGYLGQGVDVAVFDSGFIGVNTTSPFQHLFAEGRVKDVKNFVKNTLEVYSDHDHGTEVLSVMAAYQAGTYEGGAYKANYYLYETEDVASEYRVEEYNWAFAAERADSAGVDVINSSLGYNTFDDSSMDYTYNDLDGKTAVITRAARKAVERGILVVVAAGNEGAGTWKYITVPADAAGVIASGSVDYYGNHSSFSSLGPTADGRIKPDVCAMGSGTTVILYNGVVGTTSGTSLSTPLIASLVTGLRQAYPSATVKQLYSVVINSASRASSPDEYDGYGIPDFKKVTAFLDLTDEFEVYPNPLIDNEVKVFFKNADGQLVRISVSSLLGEERSSKEVSVTWNNNPLKVNFSENLSKGIYLLKIQTPASTSTRRLVKNY